jgi:hypothetical protein
MSGGFGSDRVAVLMFLACKYVSMKGGAVTYHAHPP